MHLKENLVRYMMFPLIDITSRTSVLRYLDLYRRSQWWDFQRLKILQEKKMREMISYAFNNVPYYRKTFKERNLKPEDIKSTGDLEKIPVLTHRDVRLHLDDLIAVSKSKGSLFRCQTGGTTGHPLILYQDKNEISSAKACLYRGREWCGYQMGEKKVLVWGRRLVSSKYASLKRNLVRFLTRSAFISAWDVNENRIEDIIGVLNATKPAFVSGYAEPIYILANFINQRGADLKFSLKGISTTADPLPSFKRKEIEEAFRCEVFDQYGCTEVNSLGFECEEHMGFHIPIERVHIEFLDPEDDCVISAGETGKIVVTCLENYGMPFIRYNTEDLGIRKEEPCSCGRNLPLMGSIVGRTADLIRLPNGGIVYPGFFDYALEELEWIAKYGIVQFQVVQKKLDYIVLKIQSQKKPSHQALASFTSLVTKHIGNVAFEIEIVDQIPVTASGKRKYTISEVANQTRNI